MRMPEPLGEPRDVGLLLRQDEGHAGPAPAGAPRAADAVDVVVVRPRRIEVDHMRDVIDVESTGGDVGRDEGLHLAGSELRE